MKIKIVTDSSADLAQLALNDPDVSQVPLSVAFGEQTYLDGQNMLADEFYSQLTGQTAHPKTSQPSPAAFAEVYRQVSLEADAIISLHISAKLSGTINAAKQGLRLANVNCPVEIIDSRFTGMALGLIVLEAAKIARSGCKLAEALALIQQTIARTRCFVALDSLTHLEKGGRIGKAASLIGNLLSIKPILTIENGEVVPLAKVRSRKHALEKIFELALSTQPVKQAALMVATPDLQDYQVFYQQLDQALLGGIQKTYFGKLGPVLTTHGGFNTVGIAVLQAE
ncbi:MAG: domain protein DegV family [Gammaproteobacteria bacterium]|jgi:DegV family protein with EDD domain|nr:domain protein DegV family [Gammaproteobacteria bacterium]